MIISYLKIWYNDPKYSFISLSAFTSKWMGFYPNFFIKFFNDGIY